MNVKDEKNKPLDKKKSSDKPSLFKFKGKNKKQKTRVSNKEIVSETEALEAIIVCFFADGTEKYNSMTIYAMKTFMENTPKITVGLLTHDRQTKDYVMKNLPREYHHRIVHQFTSNEHIKKWNPTQYKLDLVKFDMSGFDYIFWIDSDTICFADLTPFLMMFVMSNAYFYLTPDHVMKDSKFCDNWCKNVGKIVAIPQACIMGFRADIISDFFAEWKSIWTDWVVPEPFHKYKDPNPDFPGSSFCIEQYALGMALYTREEWISKVYWFRRNYVPLPKDFRSNSLSSVSSFNPCEQHPGTLIQVRHLKSAPLPNITALLLSKNTSEDESEEFIDEFGDGIYHCYNHAYEDVKLWFETQVKQAN